MIACGITPHCQLVFLLKYLAGENYRQLPGIEIDRNRKTGRVIPWSTEQAHLLGQQQRRRNALTSLSALSAICSALKDSLDDQIKVLIKDILLG